jgi:hypothetical protein
MSSYQTVKPFPPKEACASVPTVLRVAAVVWVSVGVGLSIVRNSFSSICPAVAEPVKKPSIRAHVFRESALVVVRVPVLDDPAHRARVPVLVTLMEPASVGVAVFTWKHG